ncbi:MAG: DNA polymerase III subunit beta [Pseudomonadales bacterium]|nr:DNA polymerase III subunit beta [Pseudomonadales bacterium]
MKFTVSREKLIKPLQQVAGVVERRQTLPVLSNVLMVIEGNRLSLTGTDMEVELVAHIELDEELPSSEITVPAKKLVDICKSLPNDSDISFELNDQKMTVKSGRSRFSLATLPANDFPNLEEATGDIEFSINQGYLKQIIDRTSFAMAQQDVRFYLNGMLFELSENRLRAVATDGHRLALCDGEAQIAVSETTQSIVPRKGVIEIARLFSDEDGDVAIALSQNHIRVETSELRFTSKLVDGKFPDYQRVLPKKGDKIVIGEKSEMKQSFSRVAILSNEKYRGVRIKVLAGTITIVANNPEQEEAEEVISVDYDGPELEIGFNVNYLLDVLNVVISDSVKIALNDSNSSALVTDAEDESAMYVVMPMRL